MEARHFRIVVVGHVDHGKSTLIGRLLHESGALAEGQAEGIRRAPGETDPEWAFLMDHLEEERAQERTIESAQAFFATPNRTYRIIDAPGHKEFLRNMVTGAAQADAAVLVIDVEAGVCEQTRRHVALLTMLGVSQVVVAINKMDRPGGSCDAFEAVSRAPELMHLKASERLVGEPIPISAMKGWNLAVRTHELDWYEGPTLFKALDALEPPEPLSNRPLCFPVQDVYEVDGRKLIAGRVERGRIARGDAVLCLPAQSRASVRSIERYMEVRTAAEAGECIGVTLDGPDEIARGAVLCDSALPPRVVPRIQAHLFWLADDGWTEGDSLTLRCATQEVPCRIGRVRRRIDSSTLEVIETSARQLSATEAAEVDLVFDRPLAMETVEAGATLSRFVLLKNGVVSAGGTVASLSDTEWEPGGVDA